MNDWKVLGLRVTTIALAGLILLGVLLTLETGFGAETQYTIHKPCLEIVKNLYSTFGDERPVGYEQYLPLIFKVHLRFQFTAWPADHYYKFETVLLAPAGRIIRLEKTLEVWAHKHSTTFRNRLEIDPIWFKCRIIRRIAARAANRAEWGVICLEDALIWGLAHN